jgi:hypothetical protein
MLGSPQVLLRFGSCDLHERQRNCDFDDCSRTPTLASSSRFCCLSAAFAICSASPCIPRRVSDRREQARRSATTINALPVAASLHQTLCASCLHCAHTQAHGETDSMAQVSHDPHGSGLLAHQRLGIEVSSANVARAESAATTSPSTTTLSKHIVAAIHVVVHRGYQHQAARRRPVRRFTTPTAMPVGHTLVEALPSNRRHTSGHVYWMGNMLPRRCGRAHVSTSDARPCRLSVVYMQQQRGITHE